MTLQEEYPSPIKPETCRWVTGPSFLMKTPENWPADILRSSSEPAVSNKPIDAVSCRAQLTQTRDFPIHFTKFSSWLCLVRITAIVYRAVRLFRISIKNSQFRTSLLPYLTATEFINADQTSAAFTNCHPVRTTTTNQQPHQNINTVHLSERTLPRAWSLGEVST